MKKSISNIFAELSSLESQVDVLNKAKKTKPSKVKSGKSTEKTKQKKIQIPETETKQPRAKKIEVEIKRGRKQAKQEVKSRKTKPQETKLKQPKPRLPKEFQKEKEEPQKPEKEKPTSEEPEVNYRKEYYEREDTDIQDLEKPTEEELNIIARVKEMLSSDLGNVGAQTGLRILQEQIGMYGQKAVAQSLLNMAESRIFGDTGIIHDFYYIGSAMQDEGYSKKGNYRTSNYWEERLDELSQEWYIMLTGAFPTSAEALAIAEGSIANRF